VAKHHSQTCWGSKQRIFQQFVTSFIYSNEAEVNVGFPSDPKAISETIIFVMVQLYFLSFCNGIMMFLGRRIRSSHPKLISRNMKTLPETSTSKEQVLYRFQLHSMTIITWIGKMIPQMDKALEWFGKVTLMRTYKINNRKAETNNS